VTRHLASPSPLAMAKRWPPPARAAEKIRAQAGGEPVDRLRTWLALSRETRLPCGGRCPRRTSAPRGSRGSDCDVSAGRRMRRLAEDLTARGDRRLLMHTSRTQVDRVLDPADGNVTIETLQRAAAVVGRGSNASANEVRPAPSFPYVHKIVVWRTNRCGPSLSRGAGACTCAARPISPSSEPPALIRSATSWRVDS
jgi:hypothetical protein